MPSRALALLLFAAGSTGAQSVCPPTPAYTPCDVVFELSEADAAAHPNPYRTIRLDVEFRSPRFRTLRLPGFWDGGRRFLVRFAPTGPGEWLFRTSSNAPSLDGREGSISALPADSPGFLQPANVHHWAWVDGLNRKPHLWMGDTCYSFAVLERDLFEKLVETRAAQKFNHLRGLVLGSREHSRRAFPEPDRPDPAFFQELDRRVLFMNRKGIVADLILAGDENHLVELFPSPAQRERYLRYLTGRYAAMQVTWQGVQEFEEYPDGRALLREIGELLKRLDPYNHPRSTHTLATSSPLFQDGWMSYLLYQSHEDDLGAIEHQIYPAPQVNAEFAYEDSGAGRALAHHVDTDTFRRRLWNATMNGQYPTFGNTGTYGGRFPVDARYLDSPGARQMTHWFDFFSRTRFWELEPYFDVEGGRALALEGVEYVVYVERPGPVEVLVERHTYDVAWFNPRTGEYLRQKDFKGDRFKAQPPGPDQDWVLHLWREGRKESMLRSYKFESRPVLMQEIEQNPQRAPFEIASPLEESLSLRTPPRYAVKLTRQTRATRSMKWLWVGEVPADGLGFRVLGTGPEGTFRFPRYFARNLPGVLAVRLYGLNANGKLYALDHVYRLLP
ncbi:MAG: DUF5060 domain-containing protein [Bryobacterales bacterium]|nr:DUF5060 domain-containing protein [Bryobacterales bacterium]